MVEHRSFHFVQPFPHAMCSFEEISIANFYGSVDRLAQRGVSCGIGVREVEAPAGSDFVDELAGLLGVVPVEHEHVGRICCLEGSKKLLVVVHPQVQGQIWNFPKGDVTRIDPSAVHPPSGVAAVERTDDFVRPTEHDDDPSVRHDVQPFGQEEAQARIFNGPRPFDSAPRMKRRIDPGAHRIAERARQRVYALPRQLLLGQYRVVQRNDLDILEVAIRISEFGPDEFVAEKNPSFRECAGDPRSTAPVSSDDEDGM